MEYALRVEDDKLITFHAGVLILVLMEYALRAKTIIDIRDSKMRLNPCFNGICSARLLPQLQEPKQLRLNPCFNGICSAREYHYNR